MCKKYFSQKFIYLFIYLFFIIILFIYYAQWHNVNVSFRTYLSQVCLHRSILIFQTIPYFKALFQHKCAVLNSKCAVLKWKMCSTKICCNKCNVFKKAQYLYVPKLTYLIRIKLQNLQLAVIIILINQSVYFTLYMHTHVLRNLSLISCIISIRLM